MTKKKTWMVLGVIVTIMIVVGVSFAYWYSLFIQQDKNALVTACFKMNFLEDSNTDIMLEKSYPLLDEEGKKLTPYQFSITNICTSAAKYQIQMESLETSTMPDRVIHVLINQTNVLLRDDVSTTPIIGVHAYKILEGELRPQESKSFEVRVWMDESTTMNDTDAMNKEWIGKITVHTTITTEKYQDTILNGSDPVLNSGLIPVTISEDGIVKKADEAKEWYNYEKKQWANAVILNDESLDYQNGEVIPEDNIESYFVWIPKYRYQLWDLGNYSELTEIDTSKVQEISIIFGDYNTEDSIDGECTTPLVSGTTGNCKVGDYMTHPAFLSFDTNGLWVGKFETGYKGSTDKASAEFNNTDSEKVQIKPNVNSWRGIQPVHSYFTSYEYKRNLDSHMMKNTEWGAVSYLQHSKYGSMSSVRINNHEEYVTGYSAVKEPTCGLLEVDVNCKLYGVTDDITKPWNTNIGYLASTTGNISGIYDMSGGAMERMMSVMLNQNNQVIIGRNSKYHSGFNGVFGCFDCGDTSGLTEFTTGLSFPSDNKYFDSYVYAEEDESYQRRILGDATGEMGPFKQMKVGYRLRQIHSWYNDEGLSNWNFNPWLQRGGRNVYGTDAGIFAFADDPGNENVVSGFRIVLSISK